MTAKKRSAGKFPAGGVGDVIDRGKNADLYVDNPNSQLSADSKTMIKGVFDFCVGIRTAELAVEQQLVYGIRAYRTETG